MAYASFPMLWRCQNLCDFSSWEYSLQRLSKITWSFRKKLMKPRWAPVGSVSDGWWTDPLTAPAVCLSVLRCGRRTSANEWKCYWWAGTLGLGGQGSQFLQLFLFLYSDTVPVTRQCAQPPPLTAFWTLKTAASVRARILDPVESNLIGCFPDMIMSVCPAIHFADLAFTARVHGTPLVGDRVPRAR